METAACTRCGRVRKPLRRGLCGACYERMRSRHSAYGTWNPDRVAAAPVREHVEKLKTAGLSYRRLVQLAGLERSVLNTLLYGKPGRPVPQWVTSKTAQKVLSVPIPASPVDVAAPNDTTPVLGAQRRLQALVAIGWTQAHLARELGITPCNFAPLVHGARPITVRRHRQVTALFDRLEVTPGPSDRARGYARTRRWALPLQWELETIDDPEARPLPRSSVERRSKKAS